MQELLAALSPYLIVGSLALLVGAGLGYYTAAADAARNAPRCRRVGRPE